MKLTTNDYETAREAKFCMDNKKPFIRLGKAYKVESVKYTTMNGKFEISLRDLK